VALNFLGKWFGGNRSDAQVVAEVRAELDRLAAERPAFAAPVRWLRELLPDLVPLTDAVTPPTLDAAMAREKLMAGVPLLRGAALAIDAKAFSKRWQRACAALQTVQPDASVTALADAINRGRLEPQALVDAVLAGRSEDVLSLAGRAELDGGLMATVLRYTLIPLFTAIAARIAPLRDGLAWAHGYCPTCGTWPLLGEFRGLDQSRFLRCGLCADGWDVPRLWCPYCGCRDHEQIAFWQVEGEELKWRYAACDHCRGYVKMVASLSALPPLAVLVADAATLHLDLAAAERGYTNAPLP
jgi:FdhE protein